MEILGNILLVSIPAVVVCITTYIIISHFYKQEKEKRYYEMRKRQKSKTLPLRLQAYERLTLYLERIAPENMIRRLSASKITIEEIYRLILQEISREFEHNLAQQIYISPELWNHIRNTKERHIALLHEIYSILPDKGSSKQFLQLYVEKASKLETYQVAMALNLLKKECRTLF